MFKLKAKRLYFLWTWMLYWKPAADFTGLELKSFEQVCSGDLQRVAGEGNLNFLLNGNGVGLATVTR